MRPEEVAKVKAAEDMDDETFLKHVNARHIPFMGLYYVGKSGAPGDVNERIARAYHQRRHDSGKVTDHVHLPPAKRSAA